MKGNSLMAENTNNTEKSRRGRKPLGVKLVDKLDGSELARKRLKVLLQTLTGEITVSEACEVLGINGAAFYKLRERFLAESVESLEPRKTGRKPKAEEDDAEKIQVLEQEVDVLAYDLHVAKIKAKLASEMPELFENNDMDKYFDEKAEVKKKARKSPKKKRRSRRLGGRNRRK